MADYRFTKFPLGLLILVASGIGTTASAQEQEWPRDYPPPVHVAPIDELLPEQAASLARSPAMGKQPRQSNGIAQATHVVEISPPLSTVVQEQIFYDDPTPPHRVIRAVPPHPAVPLDSAMAVHPSDQHGVRFQQDQGPARSVKPTHRWQHLPHPLELPGVENDPHGAGPGRLGLGTHWVRNPPQARPAIPNASVQPSWKTPYSYGYFGSPGKRHWTRQNGYRDRYLQWTLR